MIRPKVKVGDMVLVKWDNNHKVTLKVIKPIRDIPHVYLGQARQYDEQYVFNDRNVLMIN